MDEQRDGVDSGRRLPAEEDLSGRLLADKYQVMRPLGRGGTGTVYLCFHATLDKQIAVKVLHPEQSSNPGTVTRFQREAQAAARLDHPNSIHVSDFGHDALNDRLYIAMDYIEGRDLAQLLNEDWPLSDLRVVGIMSQVLSALSAAHHLGIVHRDLKPENILVRSIAGAVPGSDTIKVCDFSIAQLSPIRLSGQPVSSRNPRLLSVTGQNMVVGTPAYMSPEQARGESQDARSDIYSAGVVLFQLLTRTVPFVAETPLSVAVMHCLTPPPPPSGYGPVNPALEAVCLKALSKTREARYQSAREMQSALEAAIARHSGAQSLARRLSVPPPAGTAIVRAEKTRDGSLIPTERVVDLGEQAQPARRRMPLVALGLAAGLAAIASLPHYFEAAHDAEEETAASDPPLNAASASTDPNQPQLRAASAAAAAEATAPALPAANTAAADAPAANPVTASVPAVSKPAVNAATASAAAVSKPVAAQPTAAAAQAREVGVLASAARMKRPRAPMLEPTLQTHANESTTFDQAYASDAPALVIPAAVGGNTLSARDANPASTPTAPGDTTPLVSTAVARNSSAPGTTSVAGNPTPATSSTPASNPGPARYASAPGTSSVVGNRPAAGNAAAVGSSATAANDATAAGIVSEAKQSVAGMVSEALKQAALPSPAAGQVLAAAANPTGTPSSVPAAPTPVAAAAPSSTPSAPPNPAKGVANPADIERARVGIGAATSHSVSKASARAALNQTALDRCYRDALLAGQAPAGAASAQLSFTTNMGGHIVSASVDGDLPKPLRQCLEQVARSGRVREVDTGEAQASVTLTFQPK